MTCKIGIYCVLGGLCGAIFGIGSGFPIIWLSGAVLTGAFAPVARWGPKHPLGQFAVIFPFAVVVGVVCTMTEAYLLMPQTRSIFTRQLVIGTATDAWLAAVLAMAAKYLRLAEDSQWRPRLRSVWVLAPMVLISGFLYLVYFTVFGGITFVLFTRKYYPNLPQPGAWFWGFEMARGVAMILVALPIIRTLRLPRWQAGIALGVLLWMVAGGAGLLLPNPYMVTSQRYIHIVEIMTQNVTLGVSVVPLLRRKDLIGIEEPARANQNAVGQCQAI
jgi:hypothetical protein